MLAILDLHRPEGITWEFLAVILVIIVAPLLVERVRIPGLVGLLLGGVAIGPHGLGIVQAGPSATASLGGFGLLYLMFLAGVELDLAVLRARRRVAVVLALLTFSLPMVAGTAAGTALDYSLGASLLLGSLLASHTLVAYPIVRQAGLTGNAAVAATVGATVLTDTLTLTVLAGVAGATTGEDSGLALALQLVLGMTLLVAWCFWVLPAVGRWFFAGFGERRTVRFVFVLGSFVSAAVLAGVVGIEGIVGAFFAGLALNRLVPNGSALMERIEFFGSALIVPIFLVSVGLKIDPSVLTRASTLGLAAVLVACCVGGKGLVALLTKPLFGFSFPEVAMVFGLSVAQAAATLAATEVGSRIGLFDATVVNAVLVLVMVSLLLAPIATAWAARRISPPSVDTSRLGRSVIVPLRRSASAAALVGLANRLAAPDGGLVKPLCVAPHDQVDARRRFCAEAEAAMAHTGADVEVLLRVAVDLSTGVFNVTAAEGGSLVVLEAERLPGAQERVLGTVEDEVVWASPVPTLLVTPLDHPPRRLVLGATSEDLRSAPVPAWELALDVASRLHASGLPVLVVGPDTARERLGGLAPFLAPAAAPSLAESIANVTVAGDLVLLAARAGWNTFGPDAATMARGGNVAIAIAAPPHHSPSSAGATDRAIKLVVGRSETGLALPSPDSL